jgi:transcriptional regulator with XRE-family HTH domain
MKHSDYIHKIEDDAEYLEGRAALKELFDLGDAVICARIEKGWSQAELAKRVGTKQANISRIESAISNPTIKLVQKLVKALDLNIVYISKPAKMTAETSFLTIQQVFDQDGNPIEWPINSNIKSTQSYREI